MSVITTDVETRLRALIGDILHMEGADLEDESRFAEIYGGDSMTSIEVLAQVEQEFEIEIPEETLPRLVDLAGVREVLTESLTAKVG